MTRLRHWVEFALVAGGVNVLRLMPLAITLRICTAIKWVVYCSFFRRRKIAIDNILAAGLARSEKEARSIARESFGSFVLMAAETAIARTKLTPANWREFVTVELPPELERVVEDPSTGIIAASAHLGNWEIVARATSLLKPVTAVVRPLANPQLRAWVERQADGFRLELMQKHDDDPLRFMRPLREGRVLALMMDQYAGRHGIPVEFLGRPAWTHKSIALLHLVTRAPLVFAYAVRTGPLRYTVRAVGPLAYRSTGDRDADVARILAALTREIETVVRRYPEQYMWGHRRWRARRSVSFDE